MIAPRRAELDRILVKAAVEAGAEVREEFVVRNLLTEGERVVGIEAAQRKCCADPEYFQQWTPS